jgi:single-strand DNA-binding protein
VPSFNRVTLIGNLTSDPQLKQLPNTNVAEFGMAINRRWKSADGEEREEVCFVDCAAFGKQADAIAQYCRKGRPLFVEGRLKFDAWEDRQSGGKRSKLSVVVENFQFLGQPDDAGSSGGGGRTQAREDPEPPGSTTVSGGRRPPARQQQGQLPLAGGRGARTGLPDTRGFDPGA